MKLMMFHGRPCLVISEDINKNEIKRPVHLDKVHVQVILKNIETLENFTHIDVGVLREFCKKGGVDFQ